MKRVHLYISGLVQGVGFRWYARSQAAAVGGVAGFARNLPDGRVEIVAEGTAEDLDRYLDALCAGGLGANISGVEKIEEEGGAGAFRGFSIRF